MKDRAVASRQPAAIVSNPPAPESAQVPLNGNGDGLAIRRILVSIDFSDCSIRALEYGLKLARELKSKLILLHILEGVNCHVEAGAEDSYTNLMQAGQDRLCQMLEGRATQKLKFELLVRIGRAGSEISDTATALGADLIVLGAQGENPMKTVPLGSTAEKVLRHATCPVLTVR